MLFNSLDFAIFLPVVFILYWFVFHKNIKSQNTLLVVASYVFYGWWDWRFLFLILLSTVVDYGVGLALARQQKKVRRKLLLLLSILVNIGLLSFFKYYNFFLDSFVTTFSFFGNSFEANRLSIILPVGISFYTFQTLSYTIDVYRERLKPTTNFVAFMAFVSFFPQLVAGPIERAKSLLPQFFRKRSFNTDNAIIGIKQIVWGLFKKLVIADTCAQYVNDIFANYQDVSSTTLVLGLIYFVFQVYGDFSGYSDIAIGTARLFDFKLMVNFKYPFFSRSYREFWQRWHISLFSWFRDYVYANVRGKRPSQLWRVISISIVFVLCGLWHGATINFMIWGFVCALLYIPELFIKTKTHTRVVAQKSFFPSLSELLAMGYVFGTFCLGAVFFRAETVSQAIAYLKRMGKFSHEFNLLGIYRYAYEALPLVVLLVLIEWSGRKKEFPLYSEKMELVKTIGVIMAIVIWGNFDEMKQFFYFQF